MENADADEAHGGNDGDDDDDGGGDDDGDDDDDGATTTIVDDLTPFIRHLASVPLASSSSASSPQSPLYQIIWCSTRRTGCSTP